MGCFLDVFCFTLMLWRECSSCRIFFITSLGQMRCLNVESQEVFLPCLCSALKFKSNYFYETCNSEVPDCQFLQKNWRTTSLLDLGLIVWKMKPLLAFWLDSRWAIFYIQLENLEECCQNQVFGTDEAFFFFYFGRAPVTLRHTKDFCLCYCCFCPPPLLPALKDHSSYLSCSKLTCGINRLKHEPFPGKDIINTMQGRESSLSQASGQMSQPFSPLATDRQAAQLKT